MPFDPAGAVDLRQAARRKAAALNQHALGYGELAEGEWRAAGIGAPDLAAMRAYRLNRIRAEPAMFACRVVGRSLDPAEWTVYVHGLAYEDPCRT